MIKKTYLITYLNPYYDKTDDCREYITRRVNGYDKKDATKNFNDEMLMKYPNMLCNPIIQSIVVMINRWQ